jgi:hypothetical protein
VEQNLRAITDRETDDERRAPAHLVLYTFRIEQKGLFLSHETRQKGTCFGSISKLKPSVENGLEAIPAEAIPAEATPAIPGRTIIV